MSQLNWSTGVPGKAPAGSAAALVEQLLWNVASDKVHLGRNSMCTRRAAIASSRIR